MSRNKISLARVQEAFNAAIRRRDGRCMIKDYEPCDGQLEASHFYTVGSCPSLRFYPPNAWTQCARHHWNHHNKAESKNVYHNWLVTNHAEEQADCEILRNRYIRYTDGLKAEIIRLCNADKLDELKQLIEKELEK